MLCLGDFNPSATIYFPLTTYASSGASVTMTGLAVTDIEIYKNGSTTQRSSDNGYALLDTDGIDFDGVTGVHGFSVDLSDNTVSGFYAAGSQYWVVVNAITVDSQTVVFLYYFTIGMKPTAADNADAVWDEDVSGHTTTGTAGRQLSDTFGTVLELDDMIELVGGINRFTTAAFAAFPGVMVVTTIATLSTQTSFTLTAGPADDDALNDATLIITDQTTNAQRAEVVVSDYTGSTKTVTLRAAATFTVATGDHVAVVANSALKPTVPRRTFNVASGGAGDADVTHWKTATAATVHSSGYPVVTLKPGTGTGEINLSSGLVRAVDASLNALATASAATAIEADTQDIQSRLPAALTAGGNIKADVLAISGDTTAADNAEAFFDGTGYAGTGNVIPTVTTLTNLPAITANWLTAAGLAADAGTEIGAAVLSALGTGTWASAIPWNAAWDAEVQSEAEDALVVHRVDELLNADSDIDGAAPPTVGSVFHELMSKTAGSFTFDQTTDSNEAIRDRGDAAWGSAGSVDAAAIAAAVATALAGVPVTPRSPVQGDDLIITRGDAYPTTDSTRRIRFSQAADETHWPSIITTATFYADPTTQTLEGASSAASITRSCTVTDSDTIDLPLTASETTALTAGTYRYQLKANVAGDIATIREGVLTVNENVNA